MMRGMIFVFLDIMTNMILIITMKVYFTLRQKIIVKQSTANEAYDQALRLEEAYLNRAEAYIEKGEYELGMDDVNAIRAERIKGEYELVANSVD